MSDKVSGGVDSAEMNHGASSKVIGLTEAETHWLAASVQQESEASGTAQGIYDKLNAALDRDPDALVEQVARVIYSFVGHYSWENYADKEAYREQAQAAIDMVFRNSSNGYYGGWASEAFADPERIAGWRLIDGNDWRA